MSEFFSFHVPSQGYFFRMFLLVWWLFQQVQWLYKVSADLHCFQLLTVHFHCSPKQKAEKQKNSIVANLSKLRICSGRRQPLKTPNISRCLWFSCEVKSEEWAQKFYTDDVSLNPICAVRVGVALTLVASYYKVSTVQRATLISIDYITIAISKTEKQHDI